MEGLLWRVLAFDESKEGLGLEADFKDGFLSSWVLLSDGLLATGISFTGGSFEIIEASLCAFLVEGFFSRGRSLSFTIVESCSLDAGIAT